MTAKEIADRFTAKIRAGLDWLPSTRQLADQTGVHRNTSAKAYQLLREIKLVKENIAGSKIQVVKSQQSQLTKAIEDLLLNGLTEPQIQQVIQSELDKRKSVKVISKQADLIEHELRAAGIPISSSGLTVSDDPADGEYHLLLTDFDRYRQQNNLRLPTTIGIITKSSYYYLQATVGLGGGEDVTYLQGDTLERQILIAKMCKLVIVDALHSDYANIVRSLPIEDQAVRQIVQVPYLQANTIDQLKERLL